MYVVHKQQSGLLIVQAVDQLGLGLSSSQKRRRQVILCAAVTADMLRGNNIIHMTEQIKLSFENLKDCRVSSESANSYAKEVHDEKACTMY